MPKTNKDKNTVLSKAKTVQKRSVARSKSKSKKNLRAKASSEDKVLNEAEQELAD